MSEIKPFPHYAGFTDFTPVVPELYWDVYSQEERIKALCMEYVKLIAFTDGIVDTVNAQYSIIEKIENDLPDLINDEVKAEIERLLESGELAEILEAAAAAFLEQKTAQIAANTAAIAAEKTRAEAAEAANTAAVAAEKTRAEAAEGANAEKIATEKARAEAAEAANTAAITAEASARTAADTAIENEISKLKNPPIKMVTIGDSWGDGWTGSETVDGWCKRLGVAMGAASNVEKHEGGAGFYVQGNSGHTFKDLLNQAASAVGSESERAKITHVVIAGGINDRKQAVADVQQGANDTMDVALEKFPNADVYIIPMMIAGRCLTSDLTLIATRICVSMHNRKNKRIHACNGAWSWIIDRTTLAGDALHPNSTGYNTITGYIMDFVMNENDGYNPSAKFDTTTSRSGLDAFGVRNGATATLYIANTGSVAEGSAMASFPLRFTPGAYFGYYLDGGDSGKLKACNSADSTSTFAIRPAYGACSNGYTTLTYAINDNY